MKKSVLFALMLSIVMLAGCGIYDKEYISINDYKPAEYTTQSDGPVNVKTSIQLKKAILELVYNEQSMGTIHFDPSYEGDPEADIQNTCMQLRLTDALCAYCEVKFTYRLRSIVNYSEAEIYVSYSPLTEPVSNIISLPYAVGIEDYIAQALDSNSERLVILISASSYSSLRMQSLVSNVFRQSPAICPVEPAVNVYMYSGEGNQRLYEINFKYSLTEDELIRRKSLIKNLDVTSDINTDSMDELHELYAICEYFSANCRVCDDESRNTLYDAMIMHESNSEGIALAFVETVHNFGIDAEIVYGQYNGVDRCWNIVEIEGEHYHLDVLAFMENGITEGFIKNDDSMNQMYRWDASSYTRCSGELSFINLPEYLPEDYIIPEVSENDIIIAENQEEDEIVSQVIEENDGSLSEESAA